MTGTLKRRVVQEMIIGDSNGIKVPEINAPGELEGAILRYIWTQDGPVTVQQVYGWLREQSARNGTLERQYTTVMNTLSNMGKKGLLNVGQAEGVSRTLFAYTAAMSEQEFAESIIQAVFKVLEDFAPHVLREQVAKFR